MVKLTLLMTFFAIVALAASTDSVSIKPKVEAVPDAGKQKVEPTASPVDTSLIKTEKTIIDKTCRMVQGKMECVPKSKRIKRKVID